MPEWDSDLSSRNARNPQKAHLWLAGWTPAGRQTQNWACPMDSTSPKETLNTSTSPNGKPHRPQELEARRLRGGRDMCFGLSLVSVELDHVVCYVRTRTSIRGGHWGELGGDNGIGKHGMVATHTVHRAGHLLVVVLVGTSGPCV